MIKNKDFIKYVSENELIFANYIMKKAGVGTWIRDNANDLVRLDTQMIELWGMEEKWKINEWISFSKDMLPQIFGISEEDLNKLQNTFSGKDSNDLLVIVHSINRPDGKVKIFEVRIEVHTRNKEGVPIIITGVNIDITDVTLVKNELERTNRELEESEQDILLINENLEQRVVEEVERNSIIERKLFNSEKLASMGEMIGNIAHQWRQPLSVISTGITGMKVQKEIGILSDDQFHSHCDLINKNAQYLSNTIDDFSNFIKGDRVKSDFILKDNINSFLHLVEGTTNNNNIKIIVESEEGIVINGYENELTQCLINIFHNSKDILIEKELEDKYIFIDTFKKDNKIIIKIKDNGGGIADNILSKIYEPYFTTKHKSQGTGLGLHMTYNIIVDGMNGNIEVSNEKYKYNDKEYIGAEFTITFEC